MRLVTFSGPPSCGKTSVISKLIPHLKGTYSPAVVKFDCLTSRDASAYEVLGVPVVTGVSGVLCPDHFFAVNIGACMEWASRERADLLVAESAGLCNRCSPHLRGMPAVCVIDVLSGVDAPRKIGPMLKLADYVVVTKGDLVSQAEREVFALQVVRANPRAKTLFVNGLTGQGIEALVAMLSEGLERTDGEPSRLRFSMPGAACSYCFGETRIGDKYAVGNVKYMDLPGMGASVGNDSAAGASSRR